MEINKIEKIGWLNRHIDVLPNESKNIIIIINDIDGSHEILCNWEPSNENDKLKSPNYLGTATCIDKQFSKFNIGFHAWSCNNSEFIYYKNI